ncbi:MAG: hypothetical protein RQ741_12060 [Wenzhouxiangellaceae bacterium]|nr:hypothetical protein [Wenzhouxiangellaceae bacterium]
MLENFSIQAAAVSITVVAAALSGCASIPGTASPTAGGDHDPRPVRAEMQVRHALPAISTDPSDAPEEMLAGSVQVGAPKGLIDYGARYQVRQGKFFQAIRDGDDPEQARGEVALQTLEQTLGSTLHLPTGAPVTLQLTRREDTRLGVDSGSTRQSTRADLRWSPGPVDLHLEWTRPDPGTQPGSGVNCDFRAGLQLPTEFLPAPAGSVVELSGQRCRGSSPAHGVAELALARWGAAWRWGIEQNTALRVLRTEPEMPAGGFAPLMPDYELGLSHSHLLPGGWQTQADVSVLRADPAANAPTAQTATDGTDWSATVALSRQLNLLAVTARWAHAAERAWFATATKPIAGDRFSLALDFGTWLTRLWPRVESAMDVSWDWRRTRDGDADGKVSWNMLIGW